MARVPTTSRWAFVLLWIGRTIAGLWSVIFLLSITAELLSGYLPGGTLLSSVLNFTFGGIGLGGVIVSLWRPRAGGIILITNGIVSDAILLARIEPQAGIAEGLITNTLTMLLPGLLLIIARHAHDANFEKRSS